MEFSKKLKKLRIEMGLTQEKFAKLTGFSRSNICEFERGTRSVSFKTIKKIAEGTNTNISFWLDENNDEISTDLFDGLKTVMDALYDTGDIAPDGSYSDRAKELMMRMLDKEVKKFAYEKKKN